VGLSGYCTGNGDMDSMVLAVAALVLSGYCTGNGDMDSMVLAVAALVLSETKSVSEFSSVCQPIYCHFNMCPIYKDFPPKKHEKFRI